MEMGYRACSTCRVPHPFPRFLRKWVGIRCHCFIAGSKEMGYRACSTCLLHAAAMVLKLKLYWDPVLERFNNDDEANSMLSRPQRAPYRFS
jgi:hypothetical protein